MSEYSADRPHRQIRDDKPFHSLIFRTASRDHTTHIGTMRSTKFCVVNTQDGIAEMIQAIVSHDQSALYMAVEASLLVLHIHPEPDCSFVVDLDSLGATAFEPCEARACQAVSAAQNATPEAGGREQTEDQGGPMPSLRAILEDNSILKIHFDCRPVFAFLAGRFGVNMRSVEDIQCQEFEGRLNREGAQGYVARDLRKCLE